MKLRIVRRLGLVSAAALVAAATGALALPASHGLVKGIDGDSYLPYKTSIVRETQEALEHKGIYHGKVDGVLDADTMKATAELQKENGLAASGVPTPRTREALGVS